MDFQLDSREIVEHLDALGYHHISKDHLKEFIQDLKRLIKNDIKKKKLEADCACVGAGSKMMLHRMDLPEFSKPHIQTDDISIVESMAPCQTSRKPGDDDKENGPNTVNYIKKTELLEAKCSKSSVNDSNDSCCHSHHRPLPKVKAFTNSNSGDCRCVKCKNDGAKKEHLRQFSSFIRPTSSNVRQGKSDPVSLYHYYQSVWSQQNLPGENPHADLRWKIRHKMMGPNTQKVVEDRKAKVVPEQPPWVDP